MDSVLYRPACFDHTTTEEGPNLRLLHLSQVMSIERQQAKVNPGDAII